MRSHTLHCAFAWTLALCLPVSCLAETVITRADLNIPLYSARDLVAPALAQAPPRQADSPPVEVPPVLSPQVETLQPLPPMAPIYTVPAAQIEKQGSQSLADVLRGMPGFAVNDVGPAADIHTGTYYRGSSINQSTFLLNGRPYGSNISTYHGATDLNTLPVESIEKVELSSGASSTLYGTEGFGGVVNVITKKGKGPPQFKAGAEWGNYSQANYQASFSGSTEQLSYRVGYQSFLTDNRYYVPEASINRGADGLLFNGDTYRNSYSGNFTFDIDPRNAISLDVTKILSRRGLLYFGFPGSCSPTLALQCDRLDHDGLNLGLGSRHQLGAGEDSVLTVNLGYNQDYFNTYGPTGVRFNRTGTLDTSLLSARVEHDWKSAPNLQLRYGLDATNNQLNSDTLSTLPNRAPFNEVENRAVFNGALFALASWSVAPSAALELGVRQTVNSRFNSYTNPSAGFRWALSPGVALRASWVLAQRNPGLDQLYVYDTVHGWLPNDQLVPETGSAYTAGFDVRFSDALEGKFTYFGSGLNNRLAVVTGQWQNVGAVATNGLEAAVRWQMAPQWSSFLNYTYTDARILTGPESGLQLGFVPYSVGQAGVGYDNGGWQANAQITYGSGSRRAFFNFDSTSTDFSPPWASLDLKARIPINPNLAITAYVENLLDIPYERVNRTYTPGLLYRIGLQTSF
ncbi:TonB-dependent receptor plug domain-containing protein [Gloeobacter morelensis]|uniref:TonB-dependent receptor n=1 Tax=Gloeobacter morelensis MG652769 TaxID=2781736 RepID=A0ABY3PJH0_9CYAN|nr:TonB-dependent receptor [Gloeobacter morelensis]UFP93801.1 TonB-dependent receptor [Gloeobacter morelensis MG652769]